MSLLRPLNERIIPPEPAETCEACGKSLPRSYMMNAILVASGTHPALPFQCPAGGHWACSPECWVKVAHACVDEHMQQLLHDTLYRPIPV